MWVGSHSESLLAGQVSIMQRGGGVEQIILETANVNTDIDNVNYFLTNLFIGSGTTIISE